MTTPATARMAAIQSRPPLLSRLYQQLLPATRARSRWGRGSRASVHVIASLAMSLACLLLSPSLLADDMSRLELTDGSIIVGEVIGMSGGVYSLRSPTLGTISIESSRIRSLRNADDLPATSDGAALANPGARYGADIDALQRELVGSPELMQMIVGLQNDPALQRAMADPELMALISAGNVDALRQHPSFLELMSHPGIRAIVEQIQPR